MTWFTKPLEVPVSNEVKTIDAVQLWEVRWWSRFGRWYTDVTPVVEAFPTQEEAQAFADSLKLAFKLVRNTEEYATVTVVKAR